MYVNSINVNVSRDSHHLLGVYVCLCVFFVCGEREERRYLVCAL